MNFITLISDIGYQNHLIGIVKAQLLQAVPNSHVIDITHNITPFNFPQAAYISKGTLNHFPEFSFHILLVNLFDTKLKHLLLAFYKNQYILCADNGLLGMILDEQPEMVMSISLDNTVQKTMLHCTQIIANTIKQIAEGTPIQQVGEPDLDFNQKNPLQPYFDKNIIEAQIIYIDSFENVVVNITQKQFETHRENRKFKIVFKRNELIENISENYSDVPEGQKLAMFNSLGYLEIAINKGNAASLFGLSSFTMDKQGSSSFNQNRLIYQTIRILFE